MRLAGLLFLNHEAFIQNLSEIRILLIGHYFQSKLGMFLSYFLPNTRKMRERKNNLNVPNKVLAETDGGDINCSYRQRFYVQRIIFFLQWTPADKFYWCK